ncbi:MAG: serine/threonine protein kinase [Alphaproteobacteria bacterium]|nr:serine/threonine protein kinase [Alphaproteobacteria bacterium]
MATIHQHALPSGYEFAGFHIEGVLGAGGFGITYRARSQAGGETVAIKEYLPSGLATREPDGYSVLPVSTDDTLDYGFGLDRFRAEAAVLAHFSHPNLVRTRDFFEANGTAYLIMDFVDGQSLYALLKPDRTLSAGELDEIVAPLLGGLEAVHAGKFLHRDIKPGNIVIQRDGAPVLIDFGAAREALGEKSQSLTSIFTPGYAPPEQYHRRGNQGPWTDIYALGATFYRCITGERPPPAVERVMTDEYVPVGANAAKDYPPALLRAVDASLRIEEADRPQNVADWRRMISGEIDDVTQITRAAARPLAPKLPPARPRKRPGARPALSEAAAPRAGGRTWRRWGTTLASFAAIVTVGTIGFYGYEQSRGGAGGEGEPVIAGRTAKPGGPADGVKRGGDGEAKRADPAPPRTAEAPKRRMRPPSGAAPPAARRAKPKVAPRAAAPAAKCPIAVVTLRAQLTANCSWLDSAFRAALVAGPRLGQPTRWHNVDRKQSGTVTFLAKSRDAAGRTCWRIRQTFKASETAPVLTGTGLVCQFGEDWRVVR